MRIARRLGLQPVFRAALTRGDIDVPAVGGDFRAIRFRGSPHFDVCDTCKGPVLVTHDGAGCEALPNCRSGPPRIIQARGGLADQPACGIEEGVRAGEGSDRYEVSDEAAEWQSTVRLPAVQVKAWRFKVKARWRVGLERKTDGMRRAGRNGCRATAKAGENGPMDVAGDDRQHLRVPSEDFR